MAQGMGSDNGIPGFSALALALSSQATMEKWLNFSQFLHL